MCVKRSEDKMAKFFKNHICYMGSKSKELHHIDDYNNIPDTSYGVIPPTTLTAGTEQDYFQVVSTTAKNNTETSMTASGTKSFTRGEQISVYAACTVGTVTPGRLVLTAE